MAAGAQGAMGKGEDSRSRFYVRPSTGLHASIGSSSIDEDSVRAVPNTALSAGMMDMVIRHCNEMRQHFDRRLDCQNDLIKQLLGKCQPSSISSEVSGGPSQVHGSDGDLAQGERAGLPRVTVESDKASELTHTIDLDAEDQRRRTQAATTGLAQRESWGRDSEVTEALKFTSAPWQRRLLRYVSSSAFELTFGILIIANSISIGVQVEYASRNPKGSEPLAFLVITYSFAVCFLVEFLLRVAAEGTHFFCSKQKLWNYLDLFFVLVSLFEASSEVLAKANAADSGNMQSVTNMRIIRIVRIARLIRVFRIFRVARFVRGLRVLVFSIVCTLKSLSWAMFLLGIIIYVFGILMTQAVIDHLPSDAAVGTDSDIDGEEQTLLRYWSTVPKSMFTLFKAVSGGVSWDIVVRPLGGIQFLWVICFLLYVTFVYFAVLNVVTGVFCQAAIESANHDQELLIQKELANKQLYVSKVRKLFDDIDKKGSGLLSLQDLENRFNDESVRAYFASLDLDHHDAWTLFKLLDTKVEHIVDVEDFAMGCLRLKGMAKRIDIEKLMYDQARMMKGLGAFSIFVEQHLRALSSLVGSPQARDDLSEVEPLHGVAAQTFMSETESLLFAWEDKSGDTSPPLQVSPCNSVLNWKPVCSQNGDDSPKYSSAPQRPSLRSDISQRTPPSPSGRRLSRGNRPSTSSRTSRRMSSLSELSHMPAVDSPRS